MLAQVLPLKLFLPPTHTLILIMKGGDWGSPRLVRRLNPEWASAFLRRCRGGLLFDTSNYLNGIAALSADGKQCVKPLLRHPLRGQCVKPLALRPPRTSNESQSSELQERTPLSESYTLRGVFQGRLIYVSLYATYFGGPGKCTTRFCI